MTNVIHDKTSTTVGWTYPVKKHVITCISSVVTVKNVSQGVLPITIAFVTLKTIEWLLLVQQRLRYQKQNPIYRFTSVWGCISWFIFPCSRVCKYSQGLYVYQNVRLCVQCATCVDHTGQMHEQTPYVNTTFRTTVKKVTMFTSACLFSNLFISPSSRDNNSGEGKEVRFLQRVCFWTNNIKQYLLLLHEKNKKTKTKRHVQKTELLSWIRMNLSSNHNNNVMWVLIQGCEPQIYSSVFAHCQGIQSNLKDFSQKLF